MLLLGWRPSLLDKKGIMLKGASFSTFLIHLIFPGREQPEHGGDFFAEEDGLLSRAFEGVFHVI